MGDPKKPRKKYKKPVRPWERSRIEEEKVLIKEFGLKNKKELWKAESILRNIRNQAKRLIGSKTEQSKKEEKQLLEKLGKLGLVKGDGKIEDILSLNKKDVLERRLESIVFKQDLSKSISQARQFIVHGHITVKDRVVRVPSYLVSLEEEGQIGFDKKSNLNKEDHPERVIRKEKKLLEKVPSKEKKKEGVKEKKVPSKEKTVVKKRVKKAEIIESVQEAQVEEIEVE